MISALIKYFEDTKNEIAFYLSTGPWIIKDTDWIKWLQDYALLHFQMLLIIFYLLFWLDASLTKNRVPLFTIKTSEDTRYTLILNKNYTPTKQEVVYLLRLLDKTTEIRTLYKIYFHWHGRLIWRFGKICVVAWKYMWCYEAQLIAEQFGVTLDYAVKAETAFSNNLASFRRAYRLLILTEAALSTKQPWLVLTLRLLFTFIIIIFCLLIFFKILKPLYLILKYPAFFLFVATRVCLGGWYLWLILNHGSKK